MSFLDKGSSSRNGQNRGAQGVPLSGAKGWLDRALQAAVDQELESFGPRGRPVPASEKATIGLPGLGGLIATCANPACESSWLQLLRGRVTPMFEGGWTCSPTCTTARIAVAVRREMEGSLATPPVHRHRVPLGLVMLEQGWISSEQLRRALDAQKAAGQGRLGSWLVRLDAVSEALITRGLSLQWNCPVLRLDLHDPAAMTVTLPRLFVEAFSALPVRVAAGRILYLGFQDRLDPVVALGVERMLGLRVEAGVVEEKSFQSAHDRLLVAKFPPTELIEADTETSMIQALGKLIEKARPVEAKLVRVHDCLWLRMWARKQTGPLPDLGGVKDVICSLGLR